MTLDEFIKFFEDAAEDWLNVDEEKIGLLYADDTECIEEYKAFCIQYAKDNQQLADWLKDYKRLKEQEPKTDSTNIPDGATNGDVIKAMFNPYKIFENTYSTHVYTTEEEFRDCDYQMICHTPWWNAPYKEESEE